MIYTIGIDPGLDGAVGVLYDGVFVAVEEMPVRVKGLGYIKREVDAEALIRTLRRHVAPDCAAHAAVERVGARPGQGSSSMFSFGDSFGVARAAVAACRYELTHVAPEVWKRHYGLSSDKVSSLELAREFFPAAELRLKKHADRAEALLMARWVYDLHYRN